MLDNVVETLLFNCDGCDSMFVDVDHECVEYTGKLVITYKGKKN